MIGFVECVLIKIPASETSGIKPAIRKAKRKLPDRSTEPPTNNINAAPASEPAPPSKPAAVEIFLNETSEVNAR